MRGVVERYRFAEMGNLEVIPGLFVHVSVNVVVPYSCTVVLFLLLAVFGELLLLILLLALSV